MKVSQSCTLSSLHEKRRDYKSFTERDKRLLSIFAILDCILAVISLTLTAVQILSFALFNELVIDKTVFMDPSWPIIFIVILCGITSLCFNSAQIFAAHQMWHEIRSSRNFSSCTNCIQSTKLWLRTSVFLTIALILKAIVLIFICYALRDAGTPAPIPGFFLGCTIYTGLELLLFRAIGYHRGQKVLESVRILRIPQITSL